MRDSVFPIKTLIAFIVAIIAIFLGITLTAPGSLKPIDEDVLKQHNKAISSGEVLAAEVDGGDSDLPSITHIKTPKEVRGIYVSAYAFITKSFQDRFEKIFDTTSVNTIVVDIKDAPGTMIYDIGIDNPCVQPSLKREDLEQLIKHYHDRGIYVIARIAVFRDACYVKQNPELAVLNTSGQPWRDKGGNYWLAPHEQQTREYIRDIAKAVYDRGFDEIQLDYIRYPSDGRMSTLRYEYADTVTSSSTSQEKRRATIQEFVSYMRKELGSIPLSADIFGMVLTNTDDLSIGQHMDDFVPNVDFISPMIYPSHFPKQWNGIVDTNKNPYQTIYQSTKQGLARMIPLVGTSTAQTMMRPWLQDFSLYGVVYNAPEVKAQIKALDDLGVKSFLLWNASNRYTPGVL